MSITRSSFDRQYEHVANIRHGAANAPWRVEFDAPLSTSQSDLANISKLVQGSVVSLNEDGNFVLGAGVGTDTNHPVPCIVMKNSFDPDVTTGITGKDQKVSTYSAVGGIVTAIPMTCGYEMETTEFTEGTYKPNDGVVADATNVGKVTVATANPGSTEVYLGHVSVAPKADRFGNKRLAFWADFIPAGIGTKA